MTSSTMSSSNRKFSSLGDSLGQSTAINYICVPISEKLKEKIYYIFRKIQPADGQNALFEFWGAQKVGKAYVLTITDQPFCLFGNNKELQLYHNANLKHKLYVHPEEKVAFGLSGHAFLTCTPVQTQNLHRYPEDERPPSDDDAIFSRIWGSFAVPLIVDGQCVGVLQFVMDTPKDSYDGDIDKVYRALEMERPIQNASLQTLSQIEEPKTSTIMIRRSKSFNHTKYSRLVPHFGLTKKDAAAKLGLKRTTFKNVCKRVRIFEWPWIPSTNPKTRINLTDASKISSSQVPVALEDMLGYSDDLSFYMDPDTTFVLPHEKTTNARAPIPETQIDQVAGIKTRLFPTPVDPLADINSEDWLSDMYTDTNEFSCKQTTNGRASVPETRVDEIAASHTSSLQIPIGILEDNGFSDNCLSDTYTDDSTFELQCEQIIYDRVNVPETQINQTAARETRPSESPVYDQQNTTNLFDNRDISIFDIVSEAHINQNAPDVTWNIEFEHRGAGFMQECDEMICQGWYGPIQSKLRVT